MSDSTLNGWLLRLVGLGWLTRDHDVDCNRVQSELVYIRVTQLLRESHPVESRLWYVPDLILISQFICSISIALRHFVDQLLPIKLVRVDDVTVLSGSRRQSRLRIFASSKSKYATCKCQVLISHVGVFAFLFLAQRQRIATVGLALSVPLPERSAGEHDE